MLTFDDEVVDRSAQQTTSELQVRGMIKDAIRAESIGKIVEVFFQVL